MGSSSLFDYSNSIRTHGVVVGVLFVLFAITHILKIDEFFVYDDLLPVHIRIINEIDVFFLVMCFAKSFYAGLYWIGFVKRVKWCLTFVTIFLVICIILQFIILIGRIREREVSFVIMLIAIVITDYQLLVTVQLRKANSEFTALMHECV